MHTPEHIKPLIEKYLSGGISKEELVLLNEWYHTVNDDEVEVINPGNVNEKELSSRIKRKLMTTISREQSLNVIKPRRSWYVPVAASLLLLIGLVCYFFIYNDDKQVVSPEQTNVSSTNKDLAPGGNKAVLILADGSSVILDSTSNGMIANQGNIEIKKLTNGQLSYFIKGKEIKENDAAFYNTISTPRGGQYQVTLSDGTKVWLNAASSIRFPVVFKGTERRVSVTGETYFEVAHNTAMPFKIKAGNSEVEVLGTHFNINAYEDEAEIKTTLLEGKVKVLVAAEQSTGQIKFLLPGQQSIISKNGNIIIQNNVDTDEAIAWKNGWFQYKSADLRSILRQIARWYDVEVQYKGNVDLHFSGQLTRSENVSKVFEKLKLTGEVNFSIEGKKIIVSR